MVSIAITKNTVVNLNIRYSAIHVLNRIDVVERLSV